MTRHLDLKSEIHQLSILTHLGAPDDDPSALEALEPETLLDTASEKRLALNNLDAVVDRIQDRFQKRRCSFTTARTVESTVTESATVVVLLDGRS